MSKSARAWIALFILFAINLLNFFDRQLLGSLGEPIRKEFHLSDTGLGTLGTVFTIMYAIVGLPVGRLSDKWSRTRLIALGTGVWSLLTAASGFVQNFTQMFVCRLGVGVGEAVCAPAGQSLIGDLFPPVQRARAMGIFMMGLPLGLFLAYMSVAFIAPHYGWRMVFKFAIIPGLLLALAALFLHEPIRGALDPARKAASATVSAPSMSPWKILSLPTMWWIIASGILHNFNMYAIGGFSAPFLQRYHALSLFNANMTASVSSGLVGAVGLLVGGYLGDKMSAKRRNGRLLLAACAMTIAAPCIFFAVDQPKGSVVAFVILMSLGSATMYVYYATVYAAIQDVIEPQLRGIAVAMYFCAMYLLGASLGPAGLGMLSDHFAHEAMRQAGATSMAEAFRATGLHNAMYVIPIFALLAAGVLFAASRTVERDIRKQEAGHAALDAAAVPLT
ncbi:MAG TPA: MFS transporter [Steroidobacteraceae bacterium]|jgi:MFS family permease|nr:MFS transporter [Steroidobacteraceae bacterium]